MTTTTTATTLTTTTTTTTAATTTNCCYDYHYYIYGGHDGDNDGLWTGMLVSGLIYQYALTTSEEARTLAWRHYAALEFLHNVTETKGFIARSAVKCNEPHGHCEPRDPNVGRGECKCEPGWSGPHCEVHDMCFGVECDHGT